jgi:hypothetical protein
MIENIVWVEADLGDASIANLVARLIKTNEILTSAGCCGCACACEDSGGDEENELADCRDGNLVLGNNVEAGQD